MDLGISCPHVGSNSATFLFDLEHVLDSIWVFGRFLLSFSLPQRYYLTDLVSTAYILARRTDENLG
jgi:hypothetical protein